MNARRKLIAALSEDSLGGIATLADVDHATQLVDAYRTEVITKAVGRLRAVPVTCTALTGPVWYGDGWNAAITTFEEIADYQKPDDEAYPGELQKLRALNLGLRAALLRRDDVEWARQQLSSLAEHEAKARTGETPDFFEPGRTYTEPDGSTDWQFRVDTVTTHPEDGERTALGWRHFRGEWEPYAYGEDDFEIHLAVGTADITPQCPEALYSPETDVLRRCTQQGPHDWHETEGGTQWRLPAEKQEDGSE